MIEQISGHERCNRTSTLTPLFRHGHNVRLGGRKIGAPALLLVSRPVDLSAEPRPGRPMPTTQSATETILEALADKLEVALDLVASAGVEAEFERIASLCSAAATLAEAGAILVASNA